MAVLQGISGMQLGDGDGGNIALSLSTRVLKILSNSSFSYLTATMMNPNEVKTGTVSYYTPEIIQTQAYGTGTTASDDPQSGLVAVNINIRRTAKYDIETFDLSRLTDSAQILGMVSLGLALSIRNDLNANFLAFVVNELTTTLKTQNIALPDLLNTTGDLTPEASRKTINVIQYEYARITKLYDKKMLGVNKAELIAIFDSIGDVNVRNAFWGITGGTDLVLADGLEGHQIGNFKYIIDNMINNSIPAGTSFSKDTALDTTNFAGILLHNEAVAMPMNFNGITQVIDTVSANPRFIAKYQFGIGVVRPNLITGFVKAIPARK